MRENNRVAKKRKNDKISLKIGFERIRAQLSFLWACIKFSSTMLLHLTYLSSFLRIAILFILKRKRRQTSNS